MEIPTATIAFGDFHLSRADAFSAPHSSDVLLPIKKGGKMLVYYFGLRITKYAIMTMATMAITPMTIRASVLNIG
jgi:hypothetical protein